MKKLITIATMLAMPLALTSSAFGQEPSKKSSKAEVEAKKPSLIFYYYDK